MENNGVKAFKTQTLKSTAFLACFCLFLIFLCCFYCSKNVLFASESGKYTFYLYSRSSNSKIVSVDASVAKQTRLQLKSVKGQSLRLDREKNNGENLLFINRQLKSKRAKLILCESGEWGESSYYFSPLIANWVVIGGKKVNLQVVNTADSIIIGSPIIFGSF